MKINLFLLLLIASSSKLMVNVFQMKFDASKEFNSRL